MKTVSFEFFSLQHAFNTLVVVFLANSAAVLFAGSQLYWLPLTAVLLAQLGVQAQTQQYSAWRVFIIYLSYALLAALTVAILTELCGVDDDLAISFLLVIIFSASYLGWLKRRFFLVGLTIQVMAVIAVFTSAAPSSGLAWQRGYLIVCAGLLVSSIRLLFFWYQYRHQPYYGRAIFLQKLKNFYRLILDTSGKEDETRFQAAWCDCLSAFELFEKSIIFPSHHLERICELSLSLGALRYRLSDKTLLNLSKEEFNCVLDALIYTLEKGSSLSLIPQNAQPLTMAIQRLEALYQNTLQTAATDPLIILLFIQDLQALQHEWLRFFSEETKSQETSSEKTSAVHRNKQISSSLMCIHKPVFPLLFPWKRALRNTAAVILAMVVGKFFLSGTAFWTVMVVMLLTQTELGLPLQQSLRRGLWLIIFVVTLTQGMLVLPPAVVWASAILLITGLSYGYAYTSRRYLSLHFPLLLLMILLILLIPASVIPTPNIRDVVLGVLCAVISIIMIFPDRPDQEFASRILPLLSSLSAYFAELMACLGNTTKLSNVQAARARVQMLYANRDEYFPVWVFEPGFNPVLHPGQYYFVVHLGQMTEILFAMNHLVRQAYEPGLFNPFLNVFEKCAVDTQNLFRHLQALLRGEQPAPLDDASGADIKVLEEKFRALINIQLEWLDFFPEQAYLAALIRYLKDVREQLLKLIATLTAQP